MTQIYVDFHNAFTTEKPIEISKLRGEIQLLHDQIHNGFNQDSFGWLSPLTDSELEEIEHIKLAATNIQINSEVLLVIGVGGSYMGARAAIEMLTHSFYNHLPDEERIFPRVFFVGNNLSSKYMTDLMDIIREKEFSINVISKSGTTIEPAIAFRIFRKILLERYGEKEACQRIYVTTDKHQGLLRKEANRAGYETFIIPENIGGRHSVLTPVGLFPIACSGIDIDELLRGASSARIELSQSNTSENIAYQYASYRNVLYREGKTIEILASYEPSLQYFAEWWKQLFAESEGKENKGIFPTTAIYSTDLHSLGQYIQEGKRNIFETIIKIGKMKEEICIENEIYNTDELNYLNGKSVNFVNDIAFEGTLHAHIEGGIPNIIIRIPEISPFIFGYLVHFFQLASAMSGFLLGVNPFNQPGVEAYKNNMFNLLSKPGNEKNIIIYG